MKFDTQFFLQRLKNLQSLLCSDSSESDENDDNGDEYKNDQPNNQSSQLPNSLLFIPGPDGRHNKGSLSVLKYLFQESVGKDIYEGYLDDKYECLEEIVLLIQATTVSIFWSREAKSVIGPLLCQYPYLIEYCPSKEEEENVDKFQLRKCQDTKKMILESVPKAGVVGVPIPLGYDDVMETENWPLLQAFALDSVVTPTGFFTARYAVVDITESLNIIFQTVDGYYLDRAFKVLHENILPHHEQMLGLLFSSISNSQRDELSAEELISPLDLLFEFGELEARFPVDPTLRPRALVGNAVRKCFGVPNSPYKWKDEFISENPSCIIESCEPSTGLRWCRTYFLQRDKYFQDLVDEEALVDSSSPRPNPQTYLTDQNEQTPIERMEALYFKLWVSLRWAVRKAFAEHNDILDAGGAIQMYITDIMSGNFVTDTSKHNTCLNILNSVQLNESERLLVHMDCMNAFGQIVKIEDVDDMGGQCWTYIRVSVHDATSANNVVVIGDTFIFSPNYSLIKSKTLSFRSLDASFHPHIQDSFCITHAIPQYRSSFGSGLEEVRARNLLAATRSIHTLSTLNLGSIVEISGVGLGSLCLVTDNPIYPFFNADIRLFTGGFVLERIDKSPLPLLISIKSHVEVMWTVDMGEAYNHGLRLLGGIDNSTFSDEILDGIFIILQLRTNFDDLDDSSLSGLERCIQYDLWNKIFPSLYPTRYIGLMVPSNSRTSSAFSTAHRSWRDFARLYDIPDLRGVRDEIPEGIFLSFLAALNQQSLKAVESFQNELFDYEDHLSSNLLQGYFSIRKDFLISENVRLENSHIAELEDGESKEGPSNLTDSNQVIAVFGSSGSGVLNIFSQLVERFQSIQNSSHHFQSRIIDLTLSSSSSSSSSSCPSQQKINQALSTLRNNSTGQKFTLIGILTSPISHLSANDILCKIQSFGWSVTTCISVVQPQAFHIAQDRLSNRLGFETWIASCNEIFHPGKVIKKNIVVILDSDLRTNDNFTSNTQAFIDSVNPEADIVRMQPTNLWLSAEIIDSIIASTEIISVKSIRNIPNSPERMTQTYPGLPSLHAIHFDPPGQGIAWEITRLQLLLRHFFPKAVLSNTLPADNSYPTLQENQGLSGIQLALFLAKVKVFSERKRQNGLANFQKLFQQFDSTIITSIQTGILSVHGIVVMSNCQVCIEATSASIIIRSCKFDDNSETNVIQVIGSFSEKDILNLHSLFGICAPYSLEKRMLLTNSDISSSIYPIIEQNSLDIPLPSGWWYDGTGYVDVHGTRLLHRPDINNLVSHYVQEKNSDIMEYNKMVESVRGYLS